MLIDEATQTKTKQELAENRAVIAQHDTSENKEEEIEVLCGVSDLHGYPDSTNSEWLLVA